MGRKRKADTVAVSREEWPIQTDPEFEKLIPPHSKEELDKLQELILAEGCREHIIVWPHDGRRLVVDGHTRLKICQAHNREYQHEDKHFENREQAEAWILATQLGRRNLSPVSLKVLRGRLYNSLKHQGKCIQTDADASGQDDQKSPTTAEVLSKEHNVAERTIRRDAEFAESLDSIVKAAGDAGRDFERGILAGTFKVPHAELCKWAEKPAAQKKNVVDKILKGGSVPKKPKTTPPPVAAFTAAWQKIQVLWEKADTDERTTFRSALPKDASTILAFLSEAS